MFNHLVDSDIDGDMERTQKRPLPSGSNKNLAAIIEPLLVLYRTSLYLNLHSL